ncbi:MAG: hypothetical protein ACI8XV_002685 [Arenicella sp.]|jgi:hypothetical protein
MKNRKTKHNLINRRELLKWSSPVVAAIVLPAHADMSPEGCVCSEAPVVKVSTPLQCTGNLSIGTAELEIAAVDEEGAIIRSIILTTNDPKSGLSSLPTGPVTVTDVDTVTIVWTGPASDGVPCVPLATNNINFKYSLVRDPATVLVETYDINPLLIDSSVS